MKVLALCEPIQLDKTKTRARCRKWQLRVRVDLGDGKRHIKTKTFRGAYTQAKAATVEFAESLEGIVVDGDTPLETWIEEFVDKRRRTHAVAKRTSDTDEEKLKCAKDNKGHVLLKDLTDNDIEELYEAAFSGKTPSGKPWSANSVKRLHISLKALFKEPKKRGWVRKDLMEGIEAPKSYKKTSGKAMSTKKMDKLLDDLDLSKMMHRAVALAVGCGLRESECTAILWDELVDCEIHVNAASERNGDRKVPKNFKARAFDVDKDIFDALDAHRGHGRIVPCQPHSISTWWGKHAKDFGLKGYRFHDLRHSFSTRMMEEGVDIRTAQEIGGWKSIEPLLEIYAHVSTKMKRKAIKKAFKKRRKRRKKKAAAS